MRTSASIHQPQSLESSYRHSLHPSLQNMCGHTVFPPDNGRTLFQSVKQSNKQIFTSSDASLKNGRSTHAWVISTGHISNLSDPYMHIKGAGSVHGHKKYLSSCRGKLQGLMAITIIAKLISDYISSPCKVSAICDNSGIVQRCSRLQFKSLRSHQQPNSDLYITQNIMTSPNNILLEWVRGHADKKPWSSIEDLKSQQLSRDEIYNVLCNRMAGDAWKSCFPIVEDPDVYATEKWAIYSQYPNKHKLVGDLKQDLYYSLGSLHLQQFVTQKYQLTPAKLTLTHTNLDALHRRLLTLKIQQRATVSKLIRNWNPTYSALCRQGREPFPLCPRCEGTVKTSSHVMICPHKSAVEQRIEGLHKFLSNLLSIHTPVYLISTLEYKLSLTLQVPFVHHYLNSYPISPDIHLTLLTAICHQNELGWDLFLRGFISHYWNEVYIQAHSSSPSSSPVQLWDQKLVEGSLKLIQSIWTTRNIFLHGTNKLEANQKLRERVLDRVQGIYKNPPKLNKHFKKIHSIPLQKRLQLDT
jgi:hypothetical protein